MTNLSFIPQTWQAPTRPIVDIFIGGVQKAGTTSFHGYLAGHQALLPPIRKEIHFFDNERIDWSRPDYSSFHASFPTYDGSRRPFDTTPIYIFWPKSLARVRAYNPGARLLFLFRDPIERAWSQWCMAYARSMENFSFEIAIRHRRSRLRGINRLDPAWRVYSYVERGLYGTQVRELLRIFPREQILFLRSRDLQLDHRHVLDRVANFLGIEPFPNLPVRSDFTRRNMNYPFRPTQEDVAYLRALFRDDIMEFAALTGLLVEDWPTINSQLDPTFT